MNYSHNFSLCAEREKHNYQTSIKNVCKNRITKLIMLCALTSVNKGFTQTWESVKQCESCGTQYPITDTLGNLYITSAFSGSANFCNTAITSRGNADGWVAKYDTVGNCIWTKTFGASNILNHQDLGYRVALDKEQNLIVVGRVCDSLVYYDNTLLTDVHSGINAFIAKVNSTNGSLIWQRTLQYDEGGGIVCITTDERNNIYLSFLLSHKLIINDTTLLVKQSTPVVIKYDKDGNLKWFKMFNAPYGLYSANMYSMKYKNGFIYGVGYFFSTLSIDGQSIINPSGNSMENGYIFKMDTSGNVLTLTKPITTSNSNSGSLINVVDINDNNQIIAFGKAGSQAQADTFNISGSNSNVVVLKLDTNLTVLNAVKIGNINYNATPYDLMSVNNKIYLLAEYINGGTVGSENVTGNGIFICKLNDSLQIEWLKTAYIVNPTDNNKNVGGYINSNKSKTKLIVAGFYEQNLNADNFALTGSSDFYAVLSDLDNTAGVARLSSVVGNKIAIYPNPTQNGVFYITPPNKGVQMPAQVRVFNASGVQVAETPLKQTTQNYAIDISTLPKGEYVLKLSIGKTVYSGRVVYE